ncbi:VOC family protein [Halobacillus sp. A5]|uniref:VOC family protein n=1 Tax=Halobacillus sp. A5 TaxID=2880263 RepID=UPI0020A68191|nr:VOC family protein [Halobacillus sp. A5]MCP3026963.1 VOC family protein [Halobacillus sp. A5]
MHPILNQIGTTFIPVRDIKKARDWYCDILGVKAEGEILFDHLYVLPMDGTGIVLDSKIFSEHAVYKVPAFHFNTRDIKTAYQFMKTKQVHLTTDIQHNQWFTFKDPDGNSLMVSEC